MKIALVTPSNLLYMPYLKNYTTILDDLNVEYDIINWDRFNIEKKNILTYKDTKIGHQRNFMDYLKYKNFIKQVVKNKHYDKLIIFGIQLGFFLNSLLHKHYKNNYILDIRDYNKILKYFNIKRVVNGSALTVISSGGFKEWLPNSNKYIINHNTTINNSDNLEKVTLEFSGKKINISNIGTIRDFEVNKKLIDSLKNSDIINLYFNGEGTDNKKIENYIKENNIINVILTGRFSDNDIQRLYYNSTIVNILISCSDLNSKTLLTNRLYQAVIFGKPILANIGTYQASIVKEYNLGLVIETFDNLENIILKYIKNIDINKYNSGRNIFINNVIKDNMEFNFRLFSFVK